jgi:hypothetical protein
VSMNLRGHHISPTLHRQAMCSLVKDQKPLLIVSQLTRETEKSRNLSNRKSEGCSAPALHAAHAVFLNTSNWPFRCICICTYMYVLYNVHIRPYVGHLALSNIHIICSFILKIPNGSSQF